MTDDEPTQTIADDTDLLLAFYGDDFTGSTDSLEGLANNGVRAVLFPEPPTAADLERFDDLDAIGVLGASRSKTPTEMENELRPMFEALASLNPPIVHYKVCSTFDSAPTVGSIGHAIDIGQSVFDSPVVPVSQGTEVPLGRYVAFSNLFAVEGDETYRIDLHPTMKDHPVTPMRESDLRRHLGEQTDRPITGLSLHELRTEATADASLRSLEEVDDEEIVILDATSVDHLEIIGKLLWDRAAISDPLFVVGSSGLEHHALVHAWAEAGHINREEQLYRKRDPVDKLVVVSGSASPTTAAQLDWAVDHGFREFRLDTEGLVDPDEARGARQMAVEAAVDALTDGESIVLYSARGPDDPAIDTTRQRFESLDVEGSLETRLGHQQGLILREVVEQTGVQRACVAGGDTSSNAIPELEIQALEAIAPVGPGAPLCRVHSDHAAFDGLEVALKGGQTGTRNDAYDYFGAVRAGGVSEDRA